MAFRQADWSSDPPCWRGIMNRIWIARNLKRSEKAKPEAHPLTRYGILVLSASLFVLMMTSSAGAPQRASELRRVREIEVGPLGGAKGQTGLAFLERSGRFLLLDRGPGALPSGESNTAAFTQRGERTGSRGMAVVVRNPINMTFDNRSGRLLILDSDTRQLFVVRTDNDGEPEPETLSSLDIAQLALNDPRGITADPEGRLYILDGLPPRIVQAEFLSDRGVILESVSPLTPDVGSDFRGIAYDPKSGHLFITELSTLTLLELTTAGKLMATRDLSSVLRGRPQSLTFAPSGDTTDDASERSLYIVEKTDAANSSLAKGQITELSLGPLAAPSSSVSTVVANLVQTIHTYLYSPPSPDPSGIAYYPLTNRLLITDSEVEEMSIFAGSNVFEINTTGALLRTAVTTSFSTEPTGIAYNPTNGHLFISDDDRVRINELNPGNDGIPFTADDTRTYFSVTATGSGDPEDVAFDSWRGILYWVDGVNSEVYRADPGANGIFDGVAPAGDDQVTSFDTMSFGVTDPEGICFNTDNGHLFILGIDAAVIAETDADGNLLRIINGSVTHAYKPAGLGYAPSSIIPGTMSLYMVARGVDNNEQASENDGEAYELSFSQLSAGNMPPSVNAGPDQTVRLPSSVILDGTVTDEGLPNPPGTVTSTWRQIEGPGTATFANAGAVDTTVSFSSSGLYVLLLTASDGELSSSDTAVVTVESVEGTIALGVRVAASTDDAEEALSGSVDPWNSDLELVDDAGIQTVGMRFNNVSIPKNAAITSAYVQFKVDETSSVATTLIIQGQAADNAATFLTSAFNISSRPRTAAAVSWSPAAWTAVGAAGTAQRTVNLASVIQEIVSRPGWLNGSSLVIIITGTGKRVAVAYNGEQAGAPLLHVEYVSTVVSTHDVAVTSVTAPTSVTLGQAQTVTVSLSNQGTFPETFLLSLSDSLGATIGAPQTVTGLAAGGSQALSFAWTPTVTGTHTLTATAATVTGETDTADNVGTATSQVSSVPVHDVAVTGVTAPTPVTLGQAQTVTVTLANQGTSAETFQVSLSDSLGATIGAPQTVTGLAAGGSQALSFAWTPTMTGTHTLTATAATVVGETDTADNVWTTTVETINNSIPSLDIRVTASSDDAEEALAGSVDRGSSDLELVEDATIQTVGLRFNNVGIPKGATITSAYIQFKVDETSSVATTLNIQGQAADNAATFSTAAFNISSRPRTAAVVSWSPAAWTTVGAVGTAQRTANLAPVIQEIVGRPGWLNGSSLVIIITGTGKRVAVAYNGEQAGAPLLHVEYVLTPAPAQDMAVAAVTAPTLVTLGQAQYEIRVGAPMQAIMTGDDFSYGSIRSLENGTSLEQKTAAQKAFTPGMLSLRIRKGSRGGSPEDSESFARTKIIVSTGVLPAADVPPVS